MRARPHIFALAGALIAVAVCASSPPAKAQSPACEAVQELPPMALWAGDPPNMKDWPGRSPVPVKESANQDGTALFNITNPTMQPFLPPAGCGTGAAVIVAPGGGFRLLSIKNEGTEVARWLAAHGVAAFVLKYRTVQSVDPKPNGPTSNAVPFEVQGARGVEDGLQALKLLRRDQARYAIRADQIGAIGFSAGAHVVSMMGLHTPVEERPNFVAPIYGGPFTSPLPTLPVAYLPPAPDAPKQPWLAPPPTPALGALPPFFLAMAQDDYFVDDGVRAFYESLFKAGYRPELHLYAKGSHGFGMKKTGLSSQYFIDEFYWWMKTIGMIR